MNDAERINTPILSEDHREEYCCSTRHQSQNKIGKMGDRKQHSSPQQCPTRSDLRFQTQKEERLQKKLLRERPYHVRPKIVKSWPIGIRRHGLAARENGSGNGDGDQPSDRQAQDRALRRRPNQAQFHPGIPAKTEPEHAHYHKRNHQTMSEAAWGPHYPLKNGEYENDFQPVRPAASAYGSSRRF